MDSEGVWVIVLSLIIAIGTPAIYVLGSYDGYREGQLDYQRGNVKYELTETGYKEIIEK
jgi:hypothetical protein